MITENYIIFNDGKKWLKGKTMSKETENTTLFSFNLVVYPHSVVNNLNDYLLFYSEVEKLFEENDGKIQSHIEEMLKRIPEKEHSEFIENYTLELHQNQYMFPSMHRESMFITLYNFLEHHLTEICHQIGDELKSNIRLNDLKGKGIERAFLFLKKIPEFNFNKISTEISFIRSSNKLRNYVVHNGGFLPNSKDDIVNKFVSSHDFLSGAPGYKVVFRNDFIPKYIEVLQSFFYELENEIHRFIDKYREHS